MPAPQTLRDEADAVFEGAMKAFRESISPKEKEIFKEFSSSREMLRDLQDTCKDNQNGRLLSKVCKNIERFASAWEPFFAVTDIVVQTHPEFAGLVWGAIRLLFLLGKNYTTYLDKLATMLHKIGGALPAYEEYFEMFTARRKDSNSPVTVELRHHRLYKTLSYVYADTIQFCQEACKIFGSKRGGAHYKPVITSDIFWKPFDTRFSALLERLQSHQDVFQREMQLEEWKHLQVQNEKREERDKLEGQALLQIREQIEKLRQSNENLELELSNRLEALESKLRTATDKMLECWEIERKEKEEISSKISEIKGWIDAPEYMREFEKAKRTRLPNTGGWLLKTQAYDKWKKVQSARNNEAPDISTPTLPKVLFIKGKPGYGKTILSSLIIEDLQDLPLPSQDAPGGSTRRPVFYYHFVSERRESCGPYDALRVILFQLVHEFRVSRNVIDNISVLIETSTGGQLRASDEEVRAALSLLLEQLPQTILVFDGVDECEDSTFFLELVRILSLSTATQVLLLGRPTVDIPRGLLTSTIYLEQSANLQDIKLFLEPQIRSMKDRNLIPQQNSVETIVNTLATRAEGMFLWAWLMTKYLQCRGISPKDRLDAIFEVGIVEGLDDLYRRILRVLGRGYSKERFLLQKIFQLITVVLRPVLVVELQNAVAIRPGQVTKASSLIVDFEESIPIICGALVEVQGDKTVRFIHSSFREFLSSDQSGVQKGDFLVDESDANVLCATICLSYLLYDIPSGPLRGTGSDASARELRSYFPFIEYALSWAQHAAVGFRTQVPNRGTASTSTHDEFYSILAQFINRPLTITAWIEASWTFGMKPSLRQLQNFREHQDSSLEVSEPFNDVSAAMTLLEDLANELDRLEKEWEHLLKDNPSTIWGPSITAFCKSSFWFATNDTFVSSMAPPDAVGSFQRQNPQRPILVRSQVSGCGHYLGIILVLPSRSYILAAERILGSNKKGTSSAQSCVSEEERRRLGKICSSGWKGRYQLRNLDTEQIVLDFEIDLPERQIYRMLLQSLSTVSPYRFPFPVAFNTDLTRFILLRSVIIIRRNTPPGASSSHVPEFKIQSLVEERAFEQDPGNFGPTTFYLSFSPTGQAFALVLGSGEANVLVSRRVQVWIEATTDGEWPTYKFQGEVTTSQFSWSNPSSYEQFIFHPYLPLIMYPEGGTTAAWLYNASKTRTFVSSHSHPLSFSSDGANLYYNSTSGTRTNKIAVNSRALRPTILPVHSQTPLDGEESFPVPQVEKKCMDIRSMLPSEIAETISAHVESNSLTTGRDSTNTDITEDGAVVRNSRLLVHLPRLQHGEATYISLLPCLEHDNFLRMVWNKSRQDTYSIYDHQPAHLPSIIHRRKQTMPNSEGSLQNSKRLLSDTVESSASNNDVVESKKQRRQ